MKKLLFSILICLGLTCATVQVHAATITLDNKSISFLAGTPFYAASAYLAYKIATHKSDGIDIRPLFYAGGSLMSLLAGGLTSALTYIGLTKSANKESK